MILCSVMDQFNDRVVKDNTFQLYIYVLAVSHTTPRRKEVYYGKD
jgi:hypothetical protein